MHLTYRARTCRRCGEPLSGLQLFGTWAGLLLTSWGVIALLLWLLWQLARAL